MASRKRPDSPQMGLLIPLHTPVKEMPEPLKITALHGPPENDDEPECPPVRLRTVTLCTDDVDVTEDTTSTSPNNYIISYMRHNGTHYGSMCLSLNQLKQMVAKAATLLGTVAVDLDALDDYNESNDEHEDKESTNE